MTTSWYRVVVLFFGAVILTACGGSDSANVSAPTSMANGTNGIEGTGGCSPDCSPGPNPVSPGPNPVPTITALYPDCMPQREVVGANSTAGAVIEGTGFAPDAVVRWNGSDRPTKFLASGQVNVQLRSDDYASAGSAVISVFNPGPGGGSSNGMKFTITSGGIGPDSITVDPSGRFAYVANQGCDAGSQGSVSAYAIDAVNGLLSPLGPSVVATWGARSFVVTSDGRFAYDAGAGTGDDLGFVDSYAIDSATGILVYQGNGGYGQSGYIPVSLALLPSPGVVLIADQRGWNGMAIRERTIDPTSGLLSPPVAEASGDAVFVTTDSAGQFAYVVGHYHSAGGPFDISSYRLDAAGALHFSGIATAALQSVGGTPLVIDRSGQHLYAVDSGSNNLLMYAVDVNSGALNAIGSISTGILPASVGIDPKNRFAYVTNAGSNDLTAYRIDPSTGKLAIVGTVPTGLAPSALAFGPFGNFIYVTNQGSNDVSMYSIDETTGVPKLLGTIGT